MSGLIAYGLLTAYAGYLGLFLELGPEVGSEERDGRQE